ncbi:hypothetical protein JI664_21620 [Rhodobacter sp. NTK016B]|uniref:hypothetical protein n=1 Tax=Rhodobacter sp. NTK016B TaxID=2759676 RepID=UPI001A8C69E7|nr:hypothetical protein [Rhodobacter sp. NTK016B]MBN8294587.1 hypothetical protein [Rhodobacter sp. NTK016B]
MTADTSPEARVYLIEKRGLYYRPEAKGYTGVKDLAGRYSLAEAAERMPNRDSKNQDGVSYIHEDDAPDFSSACYQDVREEHLTKKLAAAEAQLAAAMEGAAIEGDRHKDTGRNKILNHAVDQIERAVNHHDPETDVPIMQGVWDILDQAAVKLERRILAALEPNPAALAERDESPVAVTLTYRNWRGEVSDRVIIPRKVWYGSTKWHPEPQWLVTAWDAEKNADRDFALADFMGRPDALATRDGKMRARGMIKAVLRVKAQAAVCAAWTSRGLGAPVAEEQLEDAAAAIVELAKKEAGDDSRAARARPSHSAQHGR